MNKKDPGSMMKPIVVNHYVLTHQIQKNQLVHTYCGTVKDRQEKLKFKVFSQTMLGKTLCKETFYQQKKYWLHSDVKGLIPVYDVFSKDGYFFVVSPWIEGVSLLEKYSAEMLTPVESLTIAINIAETLVRLSSRGGAHLRLNPSNIIISSSGDVLLGDPLLLSPSRVLQLSSGGFYPPPDFLAPEQVGTPSLLSSKADQFSLGSLLLWMLTGEVPFSEEKHDSQFRKLHNGICDLLVQHELQLGPFFSMVQTLMNRDPAQRFPLLEAFLEKAVLLHNVFRPATDLPENNIPVKNQTSHVVEMENKGKRGQVENTSCEDVIHHDPIPQWNLSDLFDPDPAAVVVPRLSAGYTDGKKAPVSRAQGVSSQKTRSEVHKMCTFFRSSARIVSFSFPVLCMWLTMGVLFSGTNGEVMGIPFFISDIKSLFFNSFASRVPLALSMVFSTAGLAFFWAFIFDDSFVSRAGVWYLKKGTIFLLKSLFCCFLSYLIWIYLPLTFLIKANFIEVYLKDGIYSGDIFSEVICVVLFSLSVITQYGLAWILARHVSEI